MSTMRARALATFASLSAGLAMTALVVPAAASAQAAPELRAGRWAAEADLGPGGAGGSVLNFLSPNTAWLVGLSFNFERLKVEEEGGFFPSEEETVSAGNVGVRAGLRRYAPTGSALRPILGGGFLGTYLRQEAGAVLRQSALGGYGEIGAVYLFSSRVSLGGAAELRATYNTRTLESATSETRSTGFGIGGSVARVMGTVYF